MNNTSEYIIVKELRLIIVYYSGEITGAEIRSIMERLSHDKNYSPDFDSISDFRDCTFNIKHNEIESYISFIKDNLKIIANRKTAFLANDPTKVVITTLFSNQVKDLGLEPQVFSTVDGLLDFLKKDKFNSSRYDEILEGLRKPYSRIL